MIIKSIYTNGGVISMNKKLVPVLLKVTEERILEGWRVTVSGKVNPFPFKEATITRHGTSLNRWLKDNGWEEIAREHIRN